jgi:hypothetical protein
MRLLNQLQAVRAFLALPLPWHLLTPAWCWDTSPDAEALRAFMRQPPTDLDLSGVSVAWPDAEGKLLRIDLGTVSRPGVTKDGTDEVAA